VEYACHGWGVEWSTSLITAARVALGRGALTRARSLLAGAAVLRTRGTAEVRASAWYAEALLRQAVGDRRGVLSVCRAGLRVVDKYASLLGSVELQAHATQIGRDLAGLAIGIALSDGDARVVSRYVEALGGELRLLADFGDHTLHGQRRTTQGKLVNCRYYQADMGLSVFRR
jgi:hypothetical protein